MSMRIIAVVQARMSSSRFPGKMLAPLAGKPLIRWVLDRLNRCQQLDGVVLATSTETGDEALADAVQAAGYAVHRGALDDVLRRVLDAAVLHQADAVVRITGDCALIDPTLVDQLVCCFRDGQLDYLSNVSPPSFPDGQDCEIVRVSALEVAEREAVTKHDREHVTAFIRTRPDRFRSSNIADTIDRSRWHWSVDQPTDLQLLVDLIMTSNHPDPDLTTLIATAEAHPELIERSQQQPINEGAVRSLLAELEQAAPRPVRNRSDALWRRAQALIPAGTQTLSKGPDQWVNGFGPKYLARGQGSHVWDVDGQEYIDYPMALGPITIGHADERIIDAVCEQMHEGTTFSLMHPLELEIAEMVCQRVPCAERVRFGKNGSDATAACVRAARAFTGRDAIARHGYHGWQDWAIDSSYGIRSRGVPAATMALTRPFAYNDLNNLESLLSKQEHAAVIMEPANLHPPEPGYLRTVRDLAHHYGAVFIFDEVITGFRYARGGAQERFGITPDLCAMGKGVANGLPLSIVCGRTEYMQVFEEIFFSFTFGGECASLAAARETMRIMDEVDYWAHAERLGGRLQQAFNQLMTEFDLPAHCAGLPPWTVIVFEDCEPWGGLTLKTLFQQEMLRHGILFLGSQFICTAHSDADIDQTIAAYRKASQVLRAGIDLGAVDRLLLGAVNRPVFRRG
jgi:glutamate-1-semialdehyde aminotransferase/spore coat polysaccharide biosynthesis protein SpsF (cytidylyltransferase family)